MGTIYNAGLVYELLGESSHPCARDARSLTREAISTNARVRGCEGSVHISPYIIGFGMPSSQAPSLVIASKSVTSEDGISIFVQAAGDSRRPTLVFVHGFALSALVWDDIMQDESLLQKFHLVS